MTRTIRLRIKDKHVPGLRRLSREVDEQWENEDREKPAHDMSVPSCVNMDGNVPSPFPLGHERPAEEIPFR